MKTILFGMLSLWFSTLYTFAQTEQHLSGTITDAKTHSAIPFAQLSLPDIHATTTADENGRYDFIKIPAASYELQVQALNYKTKAITIVVKGNTTLNIALDKSEIELSEVVITGTSKATQIRKSPLPIVTLNKQYLATNISTNAIDALAKIPGVSTVTTGPNVSKPYIRGLGYNRILTLFDGVRQEGQQWGDEHGIEIDKYLVEKIELVKGPASLMYGSDALAGVVNLIPNAAAKAHLSGNYTSEYQSNNGMFGESLFLSGSNNKLEWGGRLSKRNATNFQNPVDGRVYNTAFAEIAANAFAGIHRKWGYSDANISLYDNLQEIPDGSRDSISRKFTQQITEADNFRPIVSDSDLRSYKITPLHQRVQHYRLFLKNKFFFGSSSLSLNLAAQNSRRREYSHPEQPYQNLPGLDLQLQTYNFDAKYYLPEFHQWETVFGLNGLYQSNKVDQGTEFVVPSYKQSDFGGFVTFKRDFSKLNLSGGIRYDHRNFTNSELYTKPNEQSGFDQAVPANTLGATNLFSEYHTHFSGLTGSIGMAYLFNANWSLKANTSRGYRAPNSSEISAHGVHPGTGFFQLGNPNFKPEFSLQQDLGFDFTSKRCTLSASVFVNQVTNYIYNTKIENPNGTPLLTTSGSQDYPTYQFQQGKVLLYGFEANADVHLTKALHFENSFSLIYGDNHSYTGTVKNDTNRYVPFMPPARYQGELRLDVATNSKTLSESFVKLGLNYTATQNRVFSSDNTETPTQGYTLVNLGVGSGFKNSKGATHIKVYLLGNNIFNTAYQDHLSRLKYFEPYATSPNGKLGIYNMGRNVSFKVVFLL